MLIVVRSEDGRVQSAYWQSIPRFSQNACFFQRLISDQPCSLTLNFCNVKIESEKYETIEILILLRGNERKINLKDSPIF